LFCTPFVMQIHSCWLFSTKCTVSLYNYGWPLWSLSSASLRYLQVAMNKILRRIWHLPRNSHTSIVLNTARISYVHNIIMYRYSKFISRCLDSQCFFVNCIISDSLNLAYSSIGYNCLYGNSHTKFFTDYDSQTANTIRFYRHMSGTHSPFEHYISNISS
jgi:hypothetical protein